MEAEPVPIEAAATSSDKPSRGRPKGKGTTTTNKPKTIKTANGGAAPPGTTVLPAARVSKIIKADRDITKCTKEAIFLVSVTAEHFVRRLADAAYTRARLDQRKLVTYKDVANSCAPDHEFFFLEEVIPKPVPAKEAIDRRKLRITMAGTPYIDNNVIKSARESSLIFQDEILGPDGLPLTVSGNANNGASTSTATSTAQTPMHYSSPSASPALQQQQPSYPLQATPGLPPVASGSGTLPPPVSAMNGSSSSAGLLPHPTSSSHAQAMAQESAPNHMRSAPSSAHNSAQRTIEAGAEDGRMEMD